MPMSDGPVSFVTFPIFCNNTMANTLRAWTGSYVSWRLRLPEFQDNRHMKVVRLSALRTGRFTLPPPGDILVPILPPCRRYSWYPFYPLQEILLVPILPPCRRYSWYPFYPPAGDTPGTHFTPLQEILLVLISV